MIQSLVFELPKTLYKLPVDWISIVIHGTECYRFSISITRARTIISKEINKSIIVIRLEDIPLLELI